jgi:hypothetical protein
MTWRADPTKTFVFGILLGQLPLVIVLVTLVVIL